ncbi:transposase [Streptomyces sp. A1-5]|uniref:transposase n=1 Tax=Streptomyces sp. A1-5 TaxID=2738410 RepID=UPI001F3327B0|nr:transposase [Streptomyces sp. A1-5]UJB40924.1 transposase [Streptomyces sp. A1-5]
MLTSGCAWRHLPPTFGTSPATAHRRFTVWTEAGLRRRLHRAVLSDAQGIPLAVAVPGANMHDSLALKPLIRGTPAVRSRRGPRRRRPVKLRADKAYFSAEHLAWLRERGLIARIARPGIESGERLGRHRWEIERSIAWLFGYRRLTVRYERKGSHFLAFSAWPPP